MPISKSKNECRTYRKLHRDTWKERRKSVSSESEKKGIQHVKSDFRKNQFDSLMQ